MSNLHLLLLSLLISLPFSASELGRDKPKDESTTTKPAIAVRNFAKLGESPIWKANEQCLYYIDIITSRVGRYDPNTGENYLKEIEGGIPINTILPVEETNTEFVISRGKAVYHLRWRPGSSRRMRLRELFSVEDQEPSFPLNDGKCDSKGRLWVGSFESPNPTMKAKLFSMDERGMTVQDEGVGLSNGLAWSKDEKTLYFVDSALKQINAYDFDVDAGTISNRRVVFEIEDDAFEGNFFFDGMTIDDQDHLWVAAMGAYSLLEIDPKSGEWVNTVKFPAKFVSSAAFGGPEMRDLYVTSGYDGDEENPDAGSLFVLKNFVSKGREVKGIEHNLFSKKLLRQLIRRAKRCD